MLALSYITGVLKTRSDIKLLLIKVMMEACLWSFYGDWIFEL